MTRRGAIATTGRLAGLVALASLVGCGVTEPTGEVRTLNEAIERWAAVGPASYTYTVERLCFCGEEARGPVRVTVAGGAVIDRVYVDGGAQVRAQLADLFPDIPGLFAIIADAIASNPFDMAVTYDPTTGVPVDVWIDYVQNIADEELGFRSTDLPAPTP